MLFKVANVITGSGSEASKQDEGASLTSVLETPALRVELALLVLLCTDAMRGDLTATFDPNKTHDTDSSTPSTTATAPPKKAPSPVRDLISFDEPQNEAEMAAERVRKAREREIGSTQMQALRRSALTFFDKWRAGVMHRVCDVLCVRGEVVRQAKAKRKANLEQTQREKMGNSLLIDFGGDPFQSGESGTQKEKQKKQGRYEVIENKLMSFEEPKRVLILHCVLLLLLSLEHYPAHSRVLLLHLASSLETETSILAEHEKSVAQGLLASAASQMDAEEAAKKQAESDSAARKWKVGLAAVGGAVLIGVTGGLAAPLLAAGVGTVMGGLGLGATVISGYLGALAGSSVLVGSLFGAYGGKMTGRLMKQYAKEVRDFEFIPVQDPTRPSAQRSTEWSEEQDARDPIKREQHRLRVSIGISGWLNSPSDVSKPWEIIDASRIEPFALRFELDAMLRLGNSLNDVLFNYAWDGVTYTVVSRTLLGALYAGLWPLGLIKVASVLDNPFSVAIARADKAGKVLAHALISKVQGERPVTLTGYSLGARVIHSCLVELAEQNAFGLVESVILMGAPVPSDSGSWRQVRSVVAARAVNVYSTEDYILGFLYRTSKLQMGVAGLHEVKDVYGVENVDMSKFVTGHDRYRFLVGRILAKVGFEDLDFNKVAEQEKLLEINERKKEQIRKQKQQSQQQHSTQGPAELVMVPDRKPEDLMADPAPLPDRAPSFPLERNMKMQRTGQQPARSMTAPFSEATDPFSSSIPLQTTSTHSTQSPARQPSFPVSSIRTRNQIPSNMVPTSPAPPSSTNTLVGASDDEVAGQIVMRDIDSMKFSTPMELMAARTNGVAQKEVMQREEVKMATRMEVSVVEPDEESEEEASSEFGELSMVDPVPLDD
ncbi:DUF726-domain-containing protein [Zopfia rhizophila CBS 207.26]|uniref:DUF726-domain-containing protein n=1 Tax=Zopfia rhizophila CBS 207.26 TaxID=1314779 RepID=A0A6A6DEF2_9PEZI|nr:DUF726-domain-containing protein [Zopfia rhizophila CBS 207.26]